MRTVGIRSIASVINFFVSLFAFAAWFGAIFGVVLLLAIPFVSSPMVVTAPVSFTMNLPDELLGQNSWAFEFSGGRRTPTRPAARLQRIDGSMRVLSSSRAFIFANGIALVAVGLFVAITLGKLRAVLRTLIVDKQPFVAANAARIRFIGLAVIAGELARMLVVWSENSYARTHLAIAGVAFDVLPQPRLTTIVLGLLILVIAEVFRAGTALDEEQSLTI